MVGALSILLLVATVHGLKIAIIGAGAGGSSAAYFLRNSTFEISLFEKNSIPGGRAQSVTFPVVDCTPECQSINVTAELGATIFVEANEHLFNFTQPVHRQSSDGMGFWDGTKWVYMEGSNSWSFWNNVKFAFRYGFSGPWKFATAATEAAQKFIGIYPILLSGEGFADIKDMIVRLGLSESFIQTAEEFIYSSGGSALFANEFVGGIIRNIYAQDVSEIHAFASLISIYCGMSPAFTMSNGNYQIYQEMLSQVPQLQTHFNTNIQKITKNEGGNLKKYSLWTREGEKYDSDIVILAAPLSSGIQFSKNIQFPELYQNVRYVHLHVTIVLGKLNPQYFQLENVNDIPKAIFTPAGGSSSAPFLTMAIDNSFNVSSGFPSAQVVKFFSESSLSLDVLENMFVSVQRVDRKLWNAPGSYPYLRPQSPTNEWSLPVEISDGFYYVNGYETWISTMETETVSSKNIVNLINKKYFDSVVIDE